MNIFKALSATLLLSYAALLQASPLGRETDAAFAHNNWINRKLLAYRHLDPARDQLEKAGYTINDIDFIIPSHLHWDHVGGLPDFPGIQVKILPGALEEAREHGMPPAFLVEQLAGERDWYILQLEDMPYQGFPRSLDLNQPNQALSCAVDQPR